MALTEQELAELAELESDVATEKAAAKDAAQRQRLDALRMRKRLAKKTEGVHGTDFIVIETTTGLNIGLRRPVDVEVDAFHEGEDDRATLEKFLLELVLEPTKEEVATHFAKFCGLATTIPQHVNGMLGRVREEEAKK